MAGMAENYNPRLTSIKQAIKFCGFKDAKALHDFWESEDLWILEAKLVEERVNLPEQLEAKTLGK